MSESPTHSERKLAKRTPEGKLFSGPAVPELTVSFWNETHEHVLAQRAAQAKLDSEAHAKAANEYRRRQQNLSIPLTILTSTTAGLFAITFSDSVKPYVNALLQILLIIAAVLSALHQVLDFGANAAKHREAFDSFQDFYLRIQDILTFPRHERQPIREVILALAHQHRQAHRVAPLIENRGADGGTGASIVIHPCAEPDCDDCNRYPSYKDTRVSDVFEDAEKDSNVSLPVVEPVEPASAVVAPELSATVATASSSNDVILVISEEKTDAATFVA